MPIARVAEKFAIPPPPFSGVHLGRFFDFEQSFILMISRGMVEKALNGNWAKQIT
jgi:hypothetical protein